MDAGRGPIYKAACRWNQQPTGLLCILATCRPRSPAAPCLLNSGAAFCWPLRGICHPLPATVDDVKCRAAAPDQMGKIVRWKRALGFSCHGSKVSQGYGNADQEPCFRFEQYTIGGCFVLGPAQPPPQANPGHQGSEHCQDSGKGQMAGRHVRHPRSPNLMLPDAAPPLPLHRPVLNPGSSYTL